MSVSFQFCDTVSFSSIDLQVMELQLSRCQNLLLIAHRALKISHSVNVITLSKLNHFYYFACFVHKFYIFFCCCFEQLTLFNVFLFRYIEKHLVDI